MRLRHCLTLAAGAAALSLAAFQASAHHGWAGQEEAQFELSGKVKTDVSTGLLDFIDSELLKA